MHKKIKTATYGFLFLIGSVTTNG